MARYRNRSRRAIYRHVAAFAGDAWPAVLKSSLLVGALVFTPLTGQASAVVVQEPTYGPGGQAQPPTIIEFVDRGRARIFGCAAVGDSNAREEFVGRVLAVSPDTSPLPAIRHQPWSLSHFRGTTVTQGEEAAIQTPSGEWFCGESASVVSFPGTPLSEVAIFEESPEGAGWRLVPNPFTYGGLGVDNKVSAIGNGPSVSVTPASPIDAYEQLGKAIGAPVKPGKSGITRKKH